MNTITNNKMCQELVENFEQKNLQLFNSNRSKPIKLKKIIPNHLGLHQFLQRQSNGEFLLVKHNSIKTEKS